MCRSEAREWASVTKRRHLQRQASPACLQRVALRAARWGCRTARKPAPCTSCTCHASEGQPQDRSMQSGDIGKGQSRRGTKSAEHNLKSATLTGARIEPSIAGASQPQPLRKDFRPTCTPPSLRASWWGPGAVGFGGYFGAPARRRECLAGTGCMYQNCPPGMCTARSSRKQRAMV